MRKGVMAIGALALLGGALALWLGAWPGPVFASWGAILLFGTADERFRYKPIEGRRPGGGWQRTSEHFVDEETGKPVAVWLDPVSGERRYVADRADS